MVTLVAIPDSAGLALHGIPIERIDFHHRSETGGFIVACSDPSSPYTCDWQVTSADNGTHLWTATVVTAHGGILGGAGTELLVRIDAPQRAQRPANTCTDGVDCYCDRVEDPEDPAHDPKAILCEDFEAPQLWDQAHAERYEGHGPPNYGPWYDGINYRGDNSYWVKRLGQSVSSCAFSNADPVPSLGTACRSATCGTAAEDGSGNVYDVRTGQSCIVIFEDGEAPVSGGHSPSGDVFDGRAYLGMRNSPNSGSGFITGTSLPPATEVGITEAIALSGNFPRSQVLSQPLKRDEWSGPNDTGQFWYIGGQSNAPDFANRFPFTAFIWASGCRANLDKIIVNAGEIGCTSNALLYNVGPNWNRDEEMPFDQWHCVQAHIRGLGSSNVRVTVRLNGDTLIDLEGIDGPATLDSQAWDYFGFNTYSNHFEGGGDGEEVFHYRDNYHARRGPPVSCESIGWSRRAAP